MPIHALTPEEILTHWHTQGALWLMENPDLLAAHPEAFLAAAQQCGTQPAHQTLLADLVRYGDREILLTVAENPCTPVGLLQKLIQSQFWAVRQQAAHHPAAKIAANLLEQTIQDTLRRISDTSPHDTSDTLPSEEVWLEWATFWHPQIRLWIAQYPQTPPQILRKCAQDTEADIRLAVAKHANTPEAALQVLMHDDDDRIRQSVAQHPSIQRIQQTIQQQQEQKQAGQEYTQEYTQAYTHWHPHVRRAVAENPQTPAAILTTLACDPDESVRLAVAQHPQTPSATLLELLDKYAGLYPEIRTALQNRPEVLAAMRIVQDPQTNAKTLHKWATFWHPKVRQAVAVHPHTPLSLLQTLARDQNWWVSHATIDHPSIARLFDEVGMGVGTVVVGERLEEATKHWHFAIRAAVASHRKTPIPVAEMLAEDVHGDVREAVAMHLHISASILEKLAQDAEWYVRRTVAEHSKIEPHVLARLAEDENEEVREAVRGLKRGNPQFSGGTTESHKGF